MYLDTSPISPICNIENLQKCVQVDKINVWKGPFFFSLKQKKRKKKGVCIII